MAADMPGGRTGAAGVEAAVAGAGAEAGLPSFACRKQSESHLCAGDRPLGGIHSLERIDNSFPMSASLGPSRQQKSCGNRKQLDWPPIHCKLPESCR